MNSSTLKSRVQLPKTNENKATEAVGNYTDHVLLSAELDRESAAKEAIMHRQCGVCGNIARLAAPPVRWPLYRSAAYINGPGIHVFSNESRIFHKRGNTDKAWCLGVSTAPGGDVDIVDGEFARHFSKGFANYVYVDLVSAATMKARMPQFPAVNLKQVLTNSNKALAVGGHLIIHGNTDETNDVLAQLPTLGGWILKDRRKEEEGDSNPELIVLKKMGGGKRINRQTPVAGKRACIWRSGALGDLVMVTPLAERLKADGYHVTVVTSRNSFNILDNHPAVDNVLMHEREVIHNPELGDYWNYWTGEYDKYINLSESIEGELLSLEGRREFYNSTEERSLHCGSTNYFVHTLRKGGYEPQPDKPVVPTLYFTDAEHRKARKVLEQTKAQAKVSGTPKVVMWLMKGSSFHKAYPMMQVVVGALLEADTNIVVALSGAPGEEGLGFEHPSGRVVNWIGRNSVRVSMLLTQYVDCVVGPETGMMNAAAACDTPKVVMLSHSSYRNLCEFWSNTQALIPDPAISPCYGRDGCHQLHYSLASCPLLEAYDPDSGDTIVKAPACTMAVEPPRLTAAVLKSLNIPA